MTDEQMQEVLRHRAEELRRAHPGINVAAAQPREPKSIIRRAVEWCLGLFMEARLCPECSADPVGSIFNKRRTYTARCPKCGDVWN